MGYNCHFYRKYTLLFATLIFVHFHTAHCFMVFFVFFFFFKFIYFLKLLHYSVTQHLHLFRLYSRVVWFFSFLICWQAITKEQDESKWYKQCTHKQHVHPHWCYSLLQKLNYLICVIFNMTYKHFYQYQELLFPFLKKRKSRNMKH